MKIETLNTFLVLTVLVSGLVEASLAQPVQPIAHWKADGSTENSSEGPSIIGNPALSYEQGVLGQAFSCTLNSPPIATDLDAQQSAMRSSTWSCWINAKDPGRGTRRQILSVDDGGFDRSLLLDNEFISAFTGTTSWQVAQVRPGEWTHVAVVWRRHSVVCYINGEAFEYKGKLSEQSTMRKLSIGRSPSFGERFIGLIDDIQIFDRALSEEDVLRLYEQGRLQQASSGQAQTINGTPASASLPGPGAAPEVAKLEGTSAPPASEALRVDSAAAAAHIGKHVIARGNVAAIGKSTYTGLSYINFGKPYPDMELAACFATSDTNLASLKELEGRQGVEIEGTISADGRGRPQIIVTSMQQVKSRGEFGVQRPSNQAAEGSSRSASSSDRSDGARAATADPRSEGPDPMSEFAGLPRLTVAELQKLDFPQPDARGSTDSAINERTVIIGKLRSVRNGLLLLYSGIYGPPVIVNIPNDDEETGLLRALVGKEIVVVTEMVLGPGFSPDGITVQPATFSAGGRRLLAVFPAENLVALTPTPSSSNAGATEEDGGTRTTPQAAVSAAAQGTLLEPLRVELKRDGKVSGSTTLKAGTPLPIVRQEGLRALVKHPGGETWLQTGNEWEATPIVEVTEFVSTDNVALATNAERPVVAWITKKGLWFAEQQGDRWQIELVDSFPEGEADQGASVTSTGCSVAVGKDGTVVIVYDLSIKDGFVSISKVARRSGQEWTIERGLPAGDHAIRMTGETPKVLSVQGDALHLSCLKNGEWKVETITQPRGSGTLAGELSDAGAANLLVLERPSSGSESQKDGGQIQLRHWLGNEWRSELIAPSDTPPNTYYGRTGLALAGEHKFAVYPRTESLFVLARSLGEWHMQELNPNSLGEKPRLLGIDARADGVAFLLFQGMVGKGWDRWKSQMVESRRPDLLVMERLLVPNALAVAVDSEGDPMVLFEDADQNLSIATRKRAVQLTTSQAVDGVLQLPEALPTSTTPRPATILPQKVLPGSEAERARRVAALTTTFQFPVDGEMTRFTRWGSGDKLIVFFNNNGVGSSGDDKFDTMPLRIQAELQAYFPLLDEGYSLVVWDYPHTPRLAREVGEMDKKPDLSGIAASVVEGIRKETGASEMLLVGNSMGAGVVLWDLDKISSIDGVRTLLLSPTEFFMPSVDRLADHMSNTTLIAIEPDPFLRSPEIMAWAAKHASPPGGILEADQGKYIGHLIIGRDRLTHQEVVRLIRNALQPTNQANDSSNN